MSYMKIQVWRCKEARIPRNGHDAAWWWALPCSISPSWSVTSRESFSLLCNIPFRTPSVYAPEDSPPQGWRISGCIRNWWIWIWVSPLFVAFLRSEDYKIRKIYWQKLHFRQFFVYTTPKKLYYHQKMRLHQQFLRLYIKRNAKFSYCVPAL